MERERKGKMTVEWLTNNKRQGKMKQNETDENHCILGEEEAIAAQERQQREKEKGRQISTAKTVEVTSKNSRDAVHPDPPEVAEKSAEVCAVILR
jgi:hypothetical protein